MLKNITVGFLLVFIFTFITYSFFYISFHFKISALDSVNENSRRSFRQNLFLRNLFHLSDRGDARSDYYNSTHFSKLKFEIYSSTSSSLYPGSLDLLRNELKQVINKPGGITIVAKSLDNTPAQVNSSYLDNLGKDIPKYPEDTAVMRIYVLSALQGDPNILGSTINAYSLAVFKQSLVKNDASLSVSEDLEKEVLLHEIGHLLGSEHANNYDCVMSPYVDSNDNFTLTYTPTAYCPSDIALIEEANY